MKKVAINGFGRIGRAYLRLALETDGIEVVAVNDLMDKETALYLLQYDTVHGIYDKEIELSDDGLVVGGKEILFFSERDPEQLPWNIHNIDVVIEATGVFNDYHKAYKHIVAGAKHTVITAPVKGDPPKDIEADTVLVGVNTGRANVCTITSNASCTTNAAGIPMDALNREIGIEKAVLNTIHAYTASQNVIDTVSKKKSNLRFGRAAAANIIPSTTGAAIATTQVLKGLEGKFDGIALRVPVVAGSIADITFIAKRETTVEEVNEILKRNETDLFKTTEEPLVSSDIIGLPYVSIADLNLTKVVGGNLVKVMFWYDNEEGYTQSLIEHTKNT